MLDLLSKMDGSLSIRCTKVLILHKSVMLYKSWGQPGFNILSDEFKFLEENLEYVHLEDVSFAIYPDLKEVFDKTGKKTVHALAKGTLISALPFNINPCAATIKLMETLPEVDYNPHTADHFFLVDTKTQISTAKHLYAFNKKVKVIP